MVYYCVLCLCVVFSTVGSRHTLTVQLTSGHPARQRTAQNAAAPHHDGDSRRALKKFQHFKKRRNANKSPRSQAVRDTAARTKLRKHASPSRQRRNWERVLKLRQKRKQQRQQQLTDEQMVVTPRSVDTSVVDSGLDELQNWSTTEMTLEEYFRWNEGNWLRFEDQE